MCEYCEEIKTNKDDRIMQFTKYQEFYILNDDFQTKSWLVRILWHWDNEIEWELNIAPYKTKNKNNLLTTLITNCPWCGRVLD